MTTPIRRRWPWFLLVASLAMNMLAGGFAVAHMLRPPPPPGPEHALARFIDHAARELPAADVAILRGALDGGKPLLARMHENRESFGPRLRAELSAEPFDAGRLNALFAANRAADDVARGQIEERVVETLKRLSPEGRRRLADIRLP